jgi:hypothetical protein
MAERLPRIAGWTVVRDGRLYVATRAAKLTDYQQTYGALAEIEAGSGEELKVLCTEQTRLARGLSVAEDIDRKHRNEKETADDPS